jgi:hypothetical protein
MGLDIAPSHRVDTLKDRIVGIPAFQNPKLARKT